MMFKRRHPISFLRKLGGYLYPKMGVKRTLKYYRYRAVRLPGTPTNIAIGLACGAAVSFTPFIGLHFILALFLAYILGGNYLAAAIGTVVGNPLTFFFIWLLIFQTGNWMLGTSGTESVIIEFSRLVLEGQLFSRFKEVLEPVLIPMAVGSIPHVIWVWFLTFYISKRLVGRYQHRKSKRLKIKRKRLHK